MGLTRAGEVHPESIPSRAWYIALSSTGYGKGGHSVAAPRGCHYRPPKCFGIRSSRAGDVHSQSAGPLGKAEPSVKRNATGSLKRLLPCPDVILRCSPQLSDGGR